MAWHRHYDSSTNFLSSFPPLDPSFRNDYPCPFPSQPESHFHRRVPFLSPHIRTSERTSRTDGSGWASDRFHRQERPDGRRAFLRKFEMATDQDCFSGVDNMSFPNVASPISMEHDDAEMWSRRSGIADGGNMDWTRDFAESDASVRPDNFSSSRCHPVNLGAERKFEDQTAAGINAVPETLYKPWVQEGAYFEEAKTHPAMRWSNNAGENSCSCPDCHVQAHQSRQYCSSNFPFHHLQAQQHPGNCNNGTSYQASNPQFTVPLYPPRPFATTTQNFQQDYDVLNRPSAVPAGERDIEELDDDQEGGMDGQKTQARGSDGTGYDCKKASPKSSSSNLQSSSNLHDPDSDTANESALVLRVATPSSTSPPHPESFFPNSNSSFPYHENHGLESAYMNLEALAFRLRQEKRNLRTAWQGLRHERMQHLYDVECMDFYEVARDERGGYGCWGDDVDSDEYGSEMDGDLFWRRRENRRGPLYPRYRPSRSGVFTPLRSSSYTSPFSRSLSPDPAFRLNFSHAF